MLAKEYIDIRAVVINANIGNRKVLCEDDIYMCMHDYNSVIAFVNIWCNWQNNYDKKTETKSDSVGWI